MILLLKMTANEIIELCKRNTSFYTGNFNLKLTQQMNHLDDLIKY